MSFDKPIALSLAVLAFVTAHALAQKAQDATPQGKQEIVAQFDAIDADKNGFVSRSEAQKIKGLAEVFDKADTNKDGKLDAAEFEKSMSTR